METVTRTRAAALTVVLLVVCSYPLRADVRADEKTHVQFAGMLGRMVNMFGGKAAREGVTSTVAVKGDRKATHQRARPARSSTSPKRRSTTSI